MNINPKFVDLSHYDNLQDITQVKAAGILGIINKATEGPGMVDKTFALRRPAVRVAGMLYGAYHFLRPGNMEQQAQHFLETIGDPTGLALVGDWEVNSVSVAAASQWFQAVREKVGRWPICYSDSGMLMEVFGHSGHPVFSQTRLWVAAYRAQPYWPTAVWAQPWAWQFTGDSSGPLPHMIPGIILPGSKGIDINSFDGTDEELSNTWAI